jgi:hypothetical protein
LLLVKKKKSNKIEPLYEISIRRRRRLVAFNDRNDRRFGVYATRTAAGSAKFMFVSPPACIIQNPW